MSPEHYDTEPTDGPQMPRQHKSPRGDLSQWVVQVCSCKGFDVQWLQITGILVLTQELSPEDIEASYKCQVGRGDLCTGLTLLLTE